MINILSIRCGLAFAPYLIESARAFLASGEFASVVVRQGGNGLIIRSDSEMRLRHQHHESALGPQEARHYSATLKLRNDFYDIRRMQDEIVIASIGGELLLSHPQSELWLKPSHVSRLIRAFRGEPASSLEAASSSLPEWMTISTAAGQLLISDQRTGRWVLLGADHIEELECRLKSLADTGAGRAHRKPPTISVKGVAVHLQSAFQLRQVLEAFADAGEIEPFEDVTAAYTLSVSKATEGLELRDSDRRAALTAREARKWASIIAGELERINAAQMERGQIRTVVADDDGGRWILQWGDEVFAQGAELAELRRSPDESPIKKAGALISDQTDEFVLILSPDTGACVALAPSEATRLIYS